MLDTLSCTCEAGGCERELGEDELMLAIRSHGGVRKAYECECGAVTITIGRT